MARDDDYGFDGAPDFGPIPAPTPVAPENAPTDLLACARCHRPVPLLGIVDIWHDCQTGEATPA